MKINIAIMAILAVILSVEVAKAEEGPIMGACVFDDTNWCHPDPSIQGPGGGGRR